MNKLLIDATAANLARASMFLSTLDGVEDLPPLFSIRPEGGNKTTPLRLRAYLDLGDDDQLTQIDAVRTWANALGGHVDLGEEHAAADDPDRITRTLAARALIPGAATFEVYTLLRITPAPRPAPR